ncbi:Plasmodium vivax Vir protein, putative [Plasmodium vivax]|nr:Plasmodium vivax Vir protein, putative [Plasmodium vivax]
MSSSSGSPDFLSLYGDNTKELYTERFYDAMDKEPTDLEIYDHKCKDIIVNKKTGKEEMILICKKYLRFLDKSKSWRDVVFGYDISLLLNYWLYEKIIGIYGSDNDELIKQGFSALQQIWDIFDSSRSEESYYKKCKPNLKIVNHTDWDKRKELYDYCVDCDTLYPMAIAFDKGCKYYKIIEQKTSLYEHFERECSTENNCPDFYDQCKIYKPDILLPYLQCYDEMQRQKVATKPLAQSPETVRDDSGLQRDSASTQDTHPTSQSSDIKTKVTQSVLSAAPVLLTGTMLYRYTPLGPWIRRFRGGSTNNMNAMETISSYTPEAGDIFSDESANYISYQPM